MDKFFQQKIVNDVGHYTKIELQLY